MENEIHWFFLVSKFPSWVLVFSVENGQKKVEKKIFEKHCMSCRNDRGEVPDPIWGVKNHFSWTTGVPERSSHRLWKMKFFIFLGVGNFYLEFLYPLSFVFFQNMFNVKWKKKKCYDHRLYPNDVCDYSTHTSDEINEIKRKHSGVRFFLMSGEWNSLIFLGVEISVLSPCI